MRLLTKMLRTNFINVIHQGGSIRKYPTTGRPPRCDAHMNELPIPCGPWEQFYKDRQSYYNKILFLGAVWWLFSLGMMLYTGSFYLNWSPPDLPGPPSDMVEECDDTD